MEESKKKKKKRQNDRRWQETKEKSKVVNSGSILSLNLLCPNRIPYSELLPFSPPPQALPPLLLLLLLLLMSVKSA